MKLLFSNLVFRRKRGMRERVREIEIILKKKKKKSFSWKKRYHCVFLMHQGPFSVPRSEIRSHSSH